MSTTLLQPVELRSRGFAALVESLGWVNAVRFLRQYEPSSPHDYTRDRNGILPDWGTEEMMRRLKEIPGK